MQNGEGKIEEIWYGTRLSREPITTIPFLGVFKIYYNLIGKRVGNIIIGIYIDNRLVQLYETKITSKYIGEESTFWFDYPLRFKNEGSHAISFAIGHQNKLSDKTDLLDIEWINKSRDFNITVKK